MYNTVPLVYRCSHLPRPVGPARVASVQGRSAETPSPPFPDTTQSFASLREESSFFFPFFTSLVTSLHTACGERKRQERTASVTCRGPTSPHTGPGDFFFFYSALFLFLMNTHRSLSHIIKLNFRKKTQRRDATNSLGRCRCYFAFILFLLRILSFSPPLFCYNSAFFVF